MLTGDVCGRDISSEDESRPRKHFYMSCRPNRGAFDDQEPVIAFGFRECLRTCAANVEGPDRTPRAWLHRAGPAAVVAIGRLWASFA